MLLVQLIPNRPPILHRSPDQEAFKRCILYNRKEVVYDLQSIYKVSTEEEACNALEEFDVKWSKRYPHIAKSWYNNWDHLTRFLEYPEDIRRLFYTTNSIEFVNSQLSKGYKK